MGPWLILVENLFYCGCAAIVHDDEFGVEWAKNVTLFVVCVTDSYSNRDEVE